jgi:hypothetical protein
MTIVPPVAGSIEVVVVNLFVAPLNIRIEPSETVVALTSVNPASVVIPAPAFTVYQQEN